MKFRHRLCFYLLRISGFYIYIQMHHAQEKGLITEIFFYLAAVYNLILSLAYIFCCVYLTIIPRARMGSESTAH